MKTLPLRVAAFARVWRLFAKLRKRAGGESHDGAETDGAFGTTTVEASGLRAVGCIRNQVAGAIRDAALNMARKRSWRRFFGSHVVPKEFSRLLTKIC